MLFRSARILRTGARLLLLDEITEGLAPVINQALGEVLIKLKARGMTIVLVEQNFRFAAPLATLNSWGFLVASETHLGLTRDGLLQVDRLLQEFFKPEHRTGRYA